MQSKRWQGKNSNPNLLISSGGCPGGSRGGVGRARGPCVQWPKREDRKPTIISKFNTGGQRMFRVAIY
ncbi:hypothetical protein HNY73_000743 [Argiope bruennichi]|uniref:Uncharacterized protein n=1 Tax=Argiope bruennichi TaxID=94029 RepID=A0A8T0G2T7_ARGBR|nr:hypothetical protein HNY73_000743 [Argiope bruennichi]